MVGRIRNITVVTAKEKIKLTVLRKHDSVKSKAEMIVEISFLLRHNRCL